MNKWCITQDKWINGVIGEARARNAGSTARTSGPSAGSGSNTTSLRWDLHTIQFSVNAWVFIVAVLAIFPLVPKSLSKRAYRLSFMGTACSSVYSLYALYGRPRAWTLQVVQVYFQSVIATKHFIYFIYCLTFVTSHLCLNFALISILCRSLERIAKFLRHNFSRSALYRKYLEDHYVWVESNTTTLSILSSYAEIGLGGLLLVSLFLPVAMQHCTNFYVLVHTLAFYSGVLDSLAIELKASNDFSKLYAGIAILWLHLSLNQPCVVYCFFIFFRSFSFD
ncbi:hypothetical protein ERO13_A13G091200v2 [Gossypium hirsutum]|uniref:Uncharacterized protein isoform X2 n=1 Tax=Gossypium hirsutum TaxID=3635 RepID=A0ABM2ZH95_GOSHI|nr:uncharacterized protein LOC107894577 isoform X2 [Gossypium hirsutum]KAG4165666.1 hypothetical protein ERO13_A13G091200v2 [Gossypium hirsutum]